MPYAWQMLRGSTEADYTMILQERRAWLATMNIADDVKMLAEWSALVAELDRVARESLGVDERGYQASSTNTPAPSRRRSRSFFTGGLNFFQDKSNDMASAAGKNASRPRSHSILNQIGGLLRKRSSTPPHTSPEATGESMPWSELAPPEQVERRSSFGMTMRSSTTTPTQPPTRSGSANGQGAPRRLLKKQEQLRLALAIHKEKARRRAAEGQGQSAEQVAQSTSDAMREVARAVAKARMDTLAGTGTGATTGPTTAAVGTRASVPWSATGGAGVTVGPTAGRFLVQLVHCREQTRDVHDVTATVASPAVGWV
eukprot:m.19190 g.19190  ORF g.19190 m.19190 type:complete len:314 (+) comp3669_c0_seq1:106-1047(+)